MQRNGLQYGDKGQSPLHPSIPLSEMTGYYNNLSYTMSAGVTREYTLTETLHYQDGRNLVNDTKTIRQNPFIAISVTHLPGSTHLGASYWMDHDPQITAVSYTYDQV